MIAAAQGGQDLGGYALHAWDLGLGVIPPRANGTKAPAVSEWKEYQTKRPSRQQVEASNSSVGSMVRGGNRGTLRAPAQ